MFDIRKIQEQVIFNAVKEASDENVARSIVYAGNEDNPAWVCNTMKRMEDTFDRSTLKRIRMICQCGYGMDEKLSLLNDLMAESSTLEEFAGHDRARAAGLSYEDGELYLMFPFCPCPMVAEVRRLETDTWCQCTTGYSKVIFEKAFGCDVEVELLKSIKMGDDICLMRITPTGTVQF